MRDVVLDDLKKLGLFILFVSFFENWSQSLILEVLECCRKDFFDLVFD